MEHGKDAVRRLMLATNRIDGAYYLLSKQQGINENTMALLYALSDGKPHTQKQICADWLIPKTTINTNVRELVDAGYLALSAQEHTRQKTLALTERGRAYAEEIMRGVQEAEQTAIRRTLQKFPAEFVDAMDYFADCLCAELRKQ